MKKKVTKALFTMVARREPTAVEMRAVRKHISSLPHYNHLWHCSANGIPVAMYGAILDVLHSGHKATMEACFNSKPTSVIEADYERFAEIERHFDCPTKSGSLSIDRVIWLRKDNRQRADTLTYEQRHLDYKMRQKKVMKRTRFAEA